MLAVDMARYEKSERTTWPEHHIFLRLNIQVKLIYKTHTTESSVVHDTVINASSTKLVLNYFKPSHIYVNFSLAVQISLVFKPTTNISIGQSGVTLKGLHDDLKQKGN
jgi:hypothetical protein